MISHADPMGVLLGVGERLPRERRAMGWSVSQ